MKKLYDIPGYESKYAATEDGEIYSYEKGGFLKPAPDRCGYLSVILCKNGEQKKTMVNRAVAIAILENDDPANKIEVHHIDGDVKNNAASNLQWVTHKEHQMIHGKLKRVICITDGKEFDCVQDAADYYEVNSRNIYKNCAHTTDRVRCGNKWLIFKYAQE